MNERVGFCATLFTLGAILCLGISLTSYPWDISIMQAIGWVLIEGVVDLVLSVVLTAWWLQ